MVAPSIDVRAGGINVRLFVRRDKPPRGGGFRRRHEGVHAFEQTRHPHFPVQEVLCEPF
jgi:hypothetical protein